jgi:arylsulfatase
MITRVLTFLLVAAMATSCQNKTTDKEKSPEGDASKPNVLLIVADDLGFSDIAPYGGNINTPVLSTLSKEAVLFSNFHVLPTCSPTRSAMLTGNDNHVAGIGIMHEMDYPALHALNLPGYSGGLSKQVVTIPEVLRENGYHTYMVGKWHLGEDAGMNPYDRGFEEAFILGTGGGSHFDDRKALAPPQHMEYTRNGKVVDLPSDFYSTRNYTDSMIRFIGMNKDDKKPFFAFLSYTAVHDPLHAPADYVAKYKGKFDNGWDSLWVERLNNLKALGIVPKDLKTAQNPTIPKWSSLKKEMREELARDMEVYAAMLDYMDMSIGRVIEALKANGQYDNTMIIFMSDNGANGAMATSYPGNEDGKYLGTFNNHMENRGLKGSYIEQGPGWAAASSAPFRYFKGFSSEGGIKAPLMIKMPGNTKNAGQWNRRFLHVTDLMPTIIELTHSSYPATYKGNTIHPLIGKSMMPIFNSDSADIHKDDGMGYELFEMKAYIKGRWKILRLPVPLGSGDWQLYDLEVDPAETTDLSAQHPDIRSSLIEAWKKYAADNQVHDHKGHYDSFYKRTFSK